MPLFSTLKVVPPFGSTAKEVGTSELRWNNNSENTSNYGKGAKIDNYLVAMNGATNGPFEGTVVGDARGPSS